MKKYGIIMELNPFHEGHEYFLQEVKKIAGDALIICIISTYFVQRGEPTILDPKKKVELLLDRKIDIITELPMVYANQGSDYFAFHAVKILNEFGITDLIFGSESNDLAVLKDLQNRIKQNKDFVNGINNELAALKSNDILGLSYMRAIAKLNPMISVHLVKRNPNYLSATKIRQSYLRNKQLINVVSQIRNNDIAMLDYSKLELIVRQTLINNYYNQKEIFLSEDKQIINHLYKFVINNPQSSFSEIINYGINKNNSKHKIKRILLNSSLMIETKELKEQLTKEKVYINVLGFNKRGRLYLKEIGLNKRMLKDDKIWEIENRARFFYFQIMNPNFEVLIKPISDDD